MTIKPDFIKDRLFKEGETLECINSKSCGYTKGAKYTVIKDVAGVVGLKGNDGYFDPMSKLLSKFKKAGKGTLTIVD
jgi:hypothetical protein